LSSQRQCWPASWRKGTFYSLASLLRLSLLNLSLSLSLDLDRSCWGNLLFPAEQRSDLLQGLDAEIQEHGTGFASHTERGVYSRSGTSVGLFFLLDVLSLSLALSLCFRL
jgi:hypothetical protein